MPEPAERIQPEPILDTLTRLHDKATPGVTGDYAERKENRDFIVAMRKHLPKLLRVARALTKYGDHLSGCRLRWGGLKEAMDLATHNPHPWKCNCGLDAALSDLNETGAE